MSTSLLLNPITTTALTHVRERLPQSLLLSGLIGVGLRSCAVMIAGRELIQLIEPRTAKGDIDIVGGYIGVEIIRELYDATRSRSQTRQIVVIDNAERMTPAAQGAFLKLLEEPNDSVYFILTSHTPHQLLPTILSRLQQQEIRPITKSQTEELLNSLKIFDERIRSQYIFLANGLPAEIHRLHDNARYFTARAEIIHDARDLIGATPYQKLLIVSRYYSDRDRALELIDASLKLLRFSVRQQREPLLLPRIDDLLTVRENITRNFSVRLQLMTVVV